MAIPTRYISLFAGVGGLDLAVSIALPESRCVCYVEGEIPAAEVLAARMHEGSLDDAPIWSDVRTFDGGPWRGKVDGIVGGFPCQDLSVAGKRAGIDGERSGLWSEFARIIGEVRPGFVFIENVPGLLANEPMRRVLGDLSALGFDAEWISLSASAVGAPHKRERVFVLAYTAEVGRRQYSIPERDEGETSEWRGYYAVEPSNPLDAAELALTPQRGRGQPDGGGGALGNADEVRTGRTVPVCDGWQGRDGYQVAGRELANPGDRLIPQPGREPEGRAGAGSAGKVVEHPTGIRCDGYTEIHGSAGEGEDEGWLRESSGRCDNLAHAGQPGLPFAEQCSPRGDGAGGGTPGSTTELRGTLFPPGPGDIDAWRKVLVRRPWMRPAISQAEIESALRGVDDELANLVVQQRTDALRAAGNGVVALQGAAAFVELVRRLR